MNGTLLIARTAALVGDPARVNMLLALKYDESVSAGQLADIAGVSRSTAREHLLKLIDSGLVTERPVGRWRYYSLAHPVIGEILEGFEGLASQMLSKNQSGPLTTDVGMLHARCCGDHLAGELGARMAERFIAGRFISQSADGVELTENGSALLARLDIRPHELACRPRRFLYLCPDWTRSSFHLGGAVGAALLRSFIARNWMRVHWKSRRVDLTSKGYGGLRAELGMKVRKPT
jgi:DNA-binding transcriptional ArsR family regulator